MNAFAALITLTPGTESPIDVELQIIVQLPQDPPVKPMLLPFPSDLSLGYLDTLTVFVMRAVGVSSLSNPVFGPTANLPVPVPPNPPVIIQNGVGTNVLCLVNMNQSGQKVDNMGVQFGGTVLVDGEPIPWKTHDPELILQTGVGEFTQQIISSLNR